MKAASLVSHENSFQTTGIDAAGKKFILKPINVKVNSTGESFQIMDCSRENKSKDHYYEEETAKKKIILHFTMGYLKGDIATLTKGHVSVPFVVGRNGIIYNLFASKYWSYHLGPDAVGGNTPMSRESIGIEISNIGPLIKVGDNLVTTYSKTDVYCSLQETQYYTKLPTKYRTYEYFATYTEAQYKAVILLLKFLCEKYSLPKAFISADKRYLLLDETTFVNFKGIATHVNCRTGKVDIGPAFDWNRVIAAVSA